MSTNERTTHFAGFAQAVRHEEQNAVCGIGLHDWTPTKAEKVGRDVVARRVYDLVLHVLWETTPASGSTIMIPDMPDLPKEPQS